MSRTTRNRRESFESYYCEQLADRPDGVWCYYQFTEEEIPRERAQYYTKTDKWYSHSLPKVYRNVVNRRRRTHDRWEMWKTLNIQDHEGQFDPWNCKTSESWGYW